MPEIDQSSVPNLTPREAELMALLARGHTYKEVATELGISFGTVRKHVDNIRTKWHERRVRALVARWSDLRLSDRVPANGVDQKELIPLVESKGPDRDGVARALHARVVHTLNGMLTDIEGFAASGSSGFDSDQVFREFGVYQDTTRHALRSIREILSELRQQRWSRTDPNDIACVRLARDLHDTVVQTLASMIIDAEKFRAAGSERALIMRQLNSLSSSTRLALEQLREIIGGLRGELTQTEQEDYGAAFTSRLERLMDGLEEAVGIVGSLSISPSWPESLDRDAAYDLWRIIGEALHNVRQHSGARTVHVSLELDGEGRIMLSVTDDGRGISTEDSSQIGMGMLGMHERMALLGGELRIESMVPHGTRVTALVQEDRVSRREQPDAASAGEADAHGPVKSILSGSSDLTVDTHSVVDRPVQIIVADDQALFRSGLARLLNEDERIEVVGQAEDGLTAVELVVKLKPDVVLMDLKMPNLDGIEATRQILASHPRTKVLILTSFDADASIIQALKAGAAGYVLKDSQADGIVSCILAVMSGERVMASAVARRVLDMLSGTSTPREFYDGLTNREVEVLKLLASGMANKKIAYKLGVSEKTVRNHVSNIYEKLQVYDRTQAVLYAVRKGLIEF